MKVLMLTTSYPRRKGDYAGNFIHNLAKNLAKNHVEVRVLVPHNAHTKDYEDIDGVEVYRFQYMWPKKLQRVAYCSGIAESLTSPLTLTQLPLFFFFFFLHTIRHALWADVIHCHWAFSGLSGLFATRIVRKPVVCTFYGAEVYTKRFRRLVKFIGERVDCLLFISNYTKQQTLSLLTPKEYKVVHITTIDSSVLQPPKPEVLRRFYGLEDDSIIVLSVGRLVERKGFEYLIKAFSEIKTPHKTYLMIVGGGHLKNKLSELVKQLELDGRVVLAGGIPHENMNMYFSGCDVFALASILDSRGDTEGLGLVFIEAGFYSKPIVATAVGGIVDVVEDGVNGFLVDQKDVPQLTEKLERLIEDGLLRLELGKNGRMLVERKFNPQKIAGEIIRVYQQACGYEN